MGMIRGLTAVISLLFLAHPILVRGKVYTNPKDLPSTQYDFIVVGGGTAGNVVAARLTENPKVRVCVIEAGESDEGNIALQIPFTAPNILSNASLIWNYTTVPQKGLNNRVLHFERGRVLGGSSAINFMTWTRGSRDDFDRFAKVTGDRGWSWDQMQPHILRAENFTAPVDHHNTSGQFDPGAHGRKGPLSIALAGFPSDLDPRILGLTKDDPAQFTFNLDMNGGNTIGVGWTQSNTGGGQRSSSATAYIHPALSRPNLHVLLGTQATRLLAQNKTRPPGRSALPDFRQVEVAQSSSGPRTVLSATKEIVIAAGAVNTPQLLLLSGIGPKTGIKSVGLEHHVQLSGVGQHLQDHPLFALQWFANSTNTLDVVLRNETLAEALVEQWATTRAGQLVDIGSNVIGFFRFPPNSTFLRQYGDFSAGPTSGHTELYPFNGFFSFAGPTPQTDFFFSIVVNSVSPASRGTVTLTSSDPFEFPAIDPAYLSHPYDVSNAVESMRLAQRWVSQPSWSDYVLKLFGPTEIPTDSDESLIEYARSQVTTFWHPCCTAKMGSVKDDTAVVGPDLTLKGVQGVRVVDASVFPFIPAGHLQAPVYAIAERGSDLIRSRWRI